MALTPWVQRFQSHPVQTTLGQFATAMDQAEALAKKDKNAVVAFERLRQVDQRLRRLLKSVDPGLVPLGTLNSLQDYISRELAEINAYVSNSNYGHLNNANDSADTVISILGALPTPKTAADVKEIGEAATTLSQSVSDLINTLSQKGDEAGSKVDSLNGRIDETAAEISSQKGRLDAAIAQYQQQFSESENRRREEFEKAEKQREEQAAESTDKAQESVDSTIQALKEEVAKERETVSTDSTGLINQLMTYKNQAEKLVSVIGSTGMSGGYQRVANNARTISIVWHAIAFIALAGLILFTLLEFLPALKQGFTWGLFAARLLVTTGFLLLFGYAAHEAGLHHREEQRNRRLELELASIDPYLALLPDDKRVEVKRLLAERFFGQSAQFDLTGMEKTSSTVPMDLAKLLIEQLAKKIS